MLPDPPDASSVVRTLWQVEPPDGTYVGNLAFCVRVAAELRKTDPRWGLNWKRGVVDLELSQDVLAYRWGPTDADCRIIDIISKASGPWPPGEGPEPAWSVYSEAEAGPVCWFYYPEGETPPPPPPPDDDLAQALEALRTKIVLLELQHNTVLVALNGLTTAVQALAGKRAPDYEGAIRWLGTITLTPKE